MTEKLLKLKEKNLILAEFQKEIQKNNSRNKAIRSFNYPFDAKVETLEKIGISYEVN